MRKPKALWRSFLEGARLFARCLAIIHGQDRSFIPLSTLGGFLAAIQPLTSLFLSTLLLDELFGSRSPQRIAALVIVTVLVNFIIMGMRNLIDRKTRTSHYFVMFSKLDLYLNESYGRMDFEHVEKSEVTELMQRIYANMNATSGGLMRPVWGLGTLSGSLFGLIGSSVLLAGLFERAATVSGGWLTSPLASAALVLLIALATFATVKINGWFQLKMVDFFRNMPKSNTLLFYYKNYLQHDKAGKDIRLYNQRAAVGKVLRDGFMKNDYIRKTNRAESVSDASVAIVNSIVSGAVYLFVGLRALMGIYGVGSVVRYVGAVTNLCRNLTSFANIVTWLWKNNEYLRDTYAFLDMPSVKYQGTLTTEKRDDGKYDIEFHDVSFRYPGTEEYALRHVSMRFAIGQRLAVVGRNGSGKTTMIKLLCRLYDPTEGVITLNGIDIRKYDYAQYVSIFSVVFQDYHLLAFPLGQNVAASVSYDGERAMDALGKVGFDGRVSGMKDGLDTCLYKGFDENGVEVSGGEAQKIALARAVYKNAPLFILDEPTAALDPLAEYEIYAHFNEIVGGHTAIFISHRLSSCRFCDEIAVFHEGRLVQRGGHEQLLDDDEGMYARLWNAQAQYYSR